MTAIHALDIAEPTIQTLYPEPFASVVRGRTKRRLGDHFGLETFGVNLVRMSPGCVSSVRHGRACVAYRPPSIVRRHDFRADARQEL